MHSIVYSLFLGRYFFSLIRKTIKKMLFDNDMRLASDIFIDAVPVLLPGLVSLVAEYAPMCQRDFHSKDATPFCFHVRDDRPYNLFDRKHLLTHPTNSISRQIEDLSF